LPSGWRNEEEETTTTKHVPSGKSGVLLLATAVPVIAAELRVSQGGNLLLEYLNLKYQKIDLVNYYENHF
jgi:hypothetical protein